MIYLVTFFSILYVSCQLMGANTVPIGIFYFELNIECIILS